jgi:TRAP-type C4-dicarboxylate transport system permease large subunit
MASKFVGVSFPAALRASVPIYVVFFAVIAFTIFLPDAILFLPKTLFPESVGCFKAPGGTGYICP